MGNSYFQFKKFRINQDKTAMKVCTDSCILGAYISADQAKTILDIGTGTGLLALMVAQKSTAFIDAIEIEEMAYEQAKENVNASPWSNSIRIFHTSIQNFILEANHRYDLIISNPPFYSNQLKSPNTQKNIAHHSEQLSFDELINSVNQLLSEDGKFIFILPESEFKLLGKRLSENNFYETERMMIKDRSSSPIFRIIGSFQRIVTNYPTERELIIKDENGVYTEDFKKLLKDYYLNL
jgi:tRNA1Val (adenine37-N6)-methyltransferase